ncbi:hypothetical protein [Acrocarpospora sp. B8E8]|uniref:hypothetical protein n=1 Tax=Acrocarpospora sp. B8E8 TaxID=3153572 RepID=UPI00325F61FA
MTTNAPSLHQRAYATSRHARLAHGFHVLNDYTLKHNPGLLRGDLGAIERNAQAHQIMFAGLDRDFLNGLNAAARLPERRPGLVVVHNPARTKPVARRASTAGVLADARRKLLADNGFAAGANQLLRDAEFARMTRHLLDPQSSPNGRNQS